MTSSQNKRIKEPRIGILEWFHINEYERAENVMELLKNINVKDFRTAISWADWYTPDGKKWYDWLIPALSENFNLLPCISYTPPSLGILQKTSSPPKNPKDYADFIDTLINHYDKYFEWIELWNEPNNINDWDWRIDPAWKIFTEMIIYAGNWAKQRGKKTVLGGMAPTDPNWLSIMCQRDVIKFVDAVAIHGFPGTWEFDWSDWTENIDKVKDVLHYYQLNPEIWITEAGYSTWRHDEHRQLCEFVKLIQVPVERVYYYSAQDLNPNYSHQDGFHEDERHYHFGLIKADGTPKLIYRIWESEGLDGVKKIAKFKSGETVKINIKDNNYPVLITGGSGFVGTNLADRILSSGKEVIIFDNLSRPGVENNLRWLTKKHGSKVKVEIADTRNPYFIQRLVQNADSIYHFAAQVAVTTSLNDPMHDFEVNVRGAINLLEGIRNLDNPPPFIFTSTNKVYGGLNDLKLYENGTRYIPIDKHTRENGINENCPLDFHSPYGCSKGSADQYIIDYARSFNIPTVVFRMSCIYGPHQFGTEDQGWVAHFLIHSLLNKPLTIYGDGKQVRDILFIDDLVEAFLLAKKNIHHLSGNAFNIGGGINNTISLIELVEQIEMLHGRKPEINFKNWRTGDQKYYVSDISKFRNATGWKPAVNPVKGIKKLNDWLEEFYFENSNRKRKEKQKFILK